MTLRLTRTAGPTATPARARRPPPRPRHPPTSTPTPDCSQSSLTLGTAKYRIQPFTSTGSTIAAVPRSPAAVAYWVQGTDVNYVFALSDAAANLALKGSLKPGDPMKIKWPGCNLSKYTALAVAPYAGQDAALLDQATSQVTVLVRAGSAADSFVLRGGFTGETQTNPATPGAGSGDIQAEIGLGDTTVAPDGQTITISVSVRNVGPAAFTVTRENVSLTSAGGQAAAFMAADPALPRSVGPGESVTFGFKFARPAGGRATFKLFDVEFDVEA